MSSATEVRKVTKQSRPRSRSLGKAGDQAISTPVLLFTDAESRDDLFVLSSQSFEAGLRPSTADNSAKSKASKKKTHVADLVADRPPMSSGRNPYGLRLQYPQDHEASSTSGIGVALGSPSQSPWIRSEPAGSFTSLGMRGPSPLGVSPLATTPPSAYPFLDESVKERGRWKIFGGLFGKKDVSHPTTPGTPFYKVQMPKAETSGRQSTATGPTSATRHHRAPSRSLEIVSTAVAESSLPHTAKSLPSSRNQALKRTATGFLEGTQTLPTQTKSLSASKNSSTPAKYSTPARFPMPPLTPPESMRVPTPPPKDFPPKASQSPQRSTATVHIAPITKTSAKPDASTKSTPMLLEIDIPNVAMERYSIMFSDVLKPRQSLLARRQGQLKQLKVGDALKEEKRLEEAPKPIPIRRATAPSPSPKSPRFSMFPTPPTSHGRTTPRHLKPVSLQRSATAPSASPRRTEFSMLAFPKRQDSHLITSTYAPSHSSDTPASLNYDWQSDNSPTSTEASEEDRLDKIDKDNPSIVIQLPDDSGSRDGSTYEVSSIVEEPQIIEAVPELVKQPTYLASNKDGEIADDDQPRSERARAMSLQRKALPSPAARRKLSVSKITNHSSENFRQMVQPNPLQSSPATPGEVRIARQLSLSRRQQMLVPITPRAVRQRQQTIIVTPEEKPQEGNTRARNGSVTAHARNKSELVVLDSV